MEDCVTPLKKRKSNTPFSSWRKLRQNLLIGKKGSILHRNSDRRDLLRYHFLRRRIYEEIFSKKEEAQKIQSVAADDECFTLSTPKGDSKLLDYDEDFVEEVRKEVEKETAVSPLEEVNELLRLHNIKITEAPLEIRLNNVSYIVPNRPVKIETVFNASVIYRLLKFCQRTFHRIPEPQMTYKRVLSNINLVLEPGRQYLVLGPPSSGKTTLLKAISGLLEPKASEKIKGVISYNGRTIEESRDFYIRNAVSYIHQLDQHAPRLTVAETLRFANQFAIRKIFNDELATKIALASLGLTNVRDTFVGDSEIRGVSGGQRRRVTVGEMLMKRAPVLCGDEISTGLDAATTFDMIEVLLYHGRAKQQTRVFALLQPSPETVSLFDDVIVLAEGRIIYSGPIEDVEDYFANIGFKCPEFTDVADFLQMIATEDGEELYDPDESVKSIRPHAPTAADLAEIFRISSQGAKILDHLHSPEQYVWTEMEESQHSASKVSSLAMSEAVRMQYANNFFKSASLILWRFLILWLRDRRVLIASLAKNILMGVSVGGVFFNTRDELSIQGALFQAGLFIMLSSVQSASSLLKDRVIYFKHADANFYSAWPFAFGRAFSQMPQMVFDTITFGTILYFMIGLADRASASNFFTYLSILTAFSFLMGAQTGFFASFASESQFQVFNSCALLAMMLFGGFILAPDAIPAYFAWLYWWNPFAWAYRALVINEFRDGRWPDPDGLLRDAGFTGPRGQTFGSEWIYFCFLYMVPYILVMWSLSAIGLMLARYTEHAASVVCDGTCENMSDQKPPEDRLEIPVKPVTLSVHNICYEVSASTSRQRLQLLKNVNAVFRPRQMCALMGSSGAGKTTLMDVIALRKRSGFISGEVRLNGWPQDPMTFRRCSGYVEQFDVQSPELTVRETVLFSARLRLDSQLLQNEKDRQTFVDQVLSEVGLSGLAHALVGSDEGGLSFEQKKRLSIAVELAASPSILFLDEPTSGLDARSASLIVQTLRKIANSSRTVCATIHQPSSAVFSMFDELLLLKRGGKVVYHGSLGKDCKQLVSYFESKGAPRIACGENPANWMLRVITSDELGDFAEIYKGSEEFASLQAELEANKETHEDQKIVFESEFAVPASRRRDLVNRRLNLIYWRSPTYNLARIMVSLIIAFLLGSVFIFRHGLDVYSEIDMRARLSVVFIAIIITGIMAILSVLPVMTKIRDMFYRHRDSGMYDSASMGIALGVAEKWFICLSTILFCVVFLSTSNIGNHDVRGLIAFWGFFTFNFAIYSYMGQLFVCLVKPYATAIILCSVFIGINNFFAGLIVRPQFMVGGFYAVPYYICPGHYAYESMALAIFHRDDRQVVANADSEFHQYLVAQNECQLGEECVGYAHQYVYVFFGGLYTELHLQRNAAILGSILFITRLLTWVALKYIRFSS